MDGVFFLGLGSLCWALGGREGFGVFSLGWAVSVLVGVMAWMGARRRLGCCVHWEYGCQDTGECSTLVDIIGGWVQMGSTWW